MKTKHFAGIFILLCSLLSLWFLISGIRNVREVNRLLELELPTENILEEEFKKNDPGNLNEDDVLEWLENIQQIRDAKYKI